MRQRKAYSDQRLDLVCSYCGNQTQTRDHVPSRILLDDPYPENLPVIPCCLECNQSFSLDEEYFACLIECLLYGTTEIAKLKREKIKVILIKKDALRQRIENAFIENDGNKFIKIEEGRVRNILVKLAKGHAKFENSEPILEDPSNIWIQPLNLLNASEFDAFFNLEPLSKAHEVGSRALQALIIDSNNNVYPSWQTVQSNIYRYVVIDDWGILTVKILLWERIAVEVAWEL